MSASQWKIDKEDFVSGLNGTSLTEIFISSAVSSLCILLRALLIGFIPKLTSPFNITGFIIDFGFLIVPMILVVTLLSDFYVQVFFVILVTSLTLIFFIKITNTQKSTNKKDGKNHGRLNDIGNIEVSTSNLPFLTSFKVYVNVASCICILAVDFHVFPRRLAKAENFGCGIMDLGVGGFIISNAVVSKEARNRWKNKKAIVNKCFKSTCVQILSSWPLLVLGLARLVSVKMSGYQEHVTEYGVHWNFFFTLAFVKIFATLILFFINVKYCALFSVILAISYQYFLSVYPVFLETILSIDRSSGIFMQNKEGIASLSGYLALYFAGIELGAYLFKPRSTLKQWIYVAFQLVCISFVLLAILLLSIYYVQPVSRRLANLSYILGFLTYTTVLLFCYLIVDILTVVLIHLNILTTDSMPNRWIPQNIVKDTKTSVGNKPKNVNFCLISAINRNQLLYFLLSNVLTGLVNSSINTMSIDNLSAVLIITIYCFCANFIIWFMHINNLTFKFW